MKITKRIIGLIILCSALCLSGCSGAQTETETTTESFAQTTVAETVKETENRIVEVPYGESDDYVAYFEFNDKGMLVSEKNRPWGAANTTYKYDEENRITEIYYATNEGMVGEGYERVTYEYNENGTIKQSNSYSLPEDELSQYCEYEYENGLLVEIKTYEKYHEEFIYSYSYEYYYNEKDLMVKSRSVSADGSYGESFYSYDDKGRLSLEEYAQGAGSTEYVYDENGNLIKEIYGFDEMELAYEYENGVVVKTVWVKDEFNSKEVNNKGSYTEYKYYDNGNIVARYWYGKNGELGEVNIDAVPEVKGNFADTIVK